jgi:hypothetical protein
VDFCSKVFIIGPRFKQSEGPIRFWSNYERRFGDEKVYLLITFGSLSSSRLLT